MRGLLLYLQLCSAPAPLPVDMTGSWRVIHPWSCDITFHRDGRLEYGKPFEEYDSKWRTEGSYLIIEDRQRNNNNNPPHTWSIRFHRDGASLVGSSAAYKRIVLQPKKGASR